MKIALLQFYSKNPTPVYDELARVLRTKGHTVWVGTPDDQGDLAWHDGAKVFHRTKGPASPRHPGLLPRSLFRRLALFFFILRVRRDVIRIHPDITQVNKTTYAGLLPRFLPSGYRMIYDVRQLGLWGDESFTGRFANWRAVRRIRRNSMKVFDLACFPSSLAAERVLGEHWKRRAAVTPIAVHEKFLGLAGRAAQEGSPAGLVRFVYVGSLVKGRRLDILLKAAALLRGSGADFELVLMGPGEGGSFFSNEAARLGLQKYVRVLPPVPYLEVPGVVSRYDVALAYVPLIEDWKYQVTLKVLEYRALGLPIIASDLPPNREVVHDGVNGLIAANTPESFAASMKRFLDPSFLASCRIQALGMRQGRTWEEVARVHEVDVYARVLRHPE